MTSSASKRLRILTYTCPDASLDTFYLLRDCLEDATGLEADLLVEDRFSGPDPKRTDPFTADLADIVVVNSTDYLRMKSESHPNMELCPAAPVYTHPLAQDRPVYFSEVLIHASNKEKYKSLKDLKGCSWAYTSENSLSGNRVVLNHLKKNMSTTAAFFGSIIESGSHQRSIRMLRDHTVIATAVASTALADYLRDHEDHKDKFVSLLSLGPLPVHPLLFNSRLSGEVKQKIIDTLLSLHTSPKFSKRLTDVGISSFVSVPADLYEIEETISKKTDGMKMNTAYY